MMDTKKKRTDIACDMFRAISAILPLQLHKDDLTYLVMQLCLHYIYYFQYFECIAQQTCSEANLISLKSMNAKNVVISFLEKQYTNRCSEVLDSVFGKRKWSHVIIDGSISYAN